METALFILGIVLLILFVVGSLIIAIIYSKKNSEKEKLNELIRNDSSYIKELNSINKKYKFEVVSKTFKLKQKFDNIRKFRNFSPDVFLAEFMISNSDSFKNLINRSKTQERMYSKYLEEYYSVKSNLTAENALKINIPYEYYKEYEQKYFNEHLQKAKIDIRFKIVWSIDNSKWEGKNKKVYSFKEASEIFYAYYRQDLSGFSGTHADFIKRERALLTESLRYDILRRDGFRCQICGATARDGVKLHVDHIVPVSKGGKTEPKNLRTLCDRCNLGKSNKIE